MRRMSPPLSTTATRTRMSASGFPDLLALVARAKCKTGLQRHVRKK
jgi:hypothetical protein